MSSIHIQVELLRLIEQLSPTELDQLVAQVHSLRAERDPSRLTAAESQLLMRINQGLPDDLDCRYSELIARRRDETLTTDEHEELLRLTDQIERLEADRLEALAELARIRGIALSTLMRDLGIPAGCDG
jgi:hypothetical protein